MQIPRQLASADSRARAKPRQCGACGRPWCRCPSSPPPPPPPTPQGQWSPGTGQVRRKLSSHVAQTNVSLHPKFKALTGRELQIVSSIRGQDLLTLSSQQPLPAHKQPRCWAALGHPALRGYTVFTLRPHGLLRSVPAARPIGLDVARAAAEEMFSTNNTEVDCTLLHSWTPL